MKQTTVLCFLLILIPSCNGQQRTPSHADQPDFDNLINAQLSEKKIPSIAIGIVKDGETVVAKGYGYANVEDKISADEKTIYQIGSVTKMFTGHLLAQFLNQRKLSLADTVAKFFPHSTTFPESPSGQVVTMKDLATHSSEFPRYPDNLQRIDPDPIKGYSKAEMVKGIESVSIDTVIGARYRYSNFGYGVLGTAMEYQTGKNLSELMDEYIFSVYGMKNTSLVFKEQFAGRLAIPYLEVSPYVRTEPWEMEALAAAGNMFSSIVDLNRFMIESMSDNDINTIQQTKYLTINETWSYGLGCFIIDSKKRNTHIVYHGGDIDGYASSLTMYPEHHLGIVLLTNWGEGQVVGELFTRINDAIVDYYLEELDE